MRRWRQGREGRGHQLRDPGSPQKLQEAGRTLPWRSGESADRAVVIGPTGAQGHVPTLSGPQSPVHKRTGQPPGFSPKTP